MKFKKLILKDFFRYYGYQEINFDVTQEKNVIALIGDNGRGKTTILSAFYFVLYNRLLEPLTKSNMLNYRKKNELKNYQDVESYVELSIEENGQEYILKRFAIFKKDSNGIVCEVTSKENGKVYKLEKNGDKKELNLKVFEDKFLIPEKLSGFFFFDGERINRLAKVDGKKEIKNAILNILGIHYLDNVQKDLNSIKKDLTEKLKKYSNNTDEKLLVMKLQQCQDKIEEKKEIISKLEKKLNDAEQSFESISSKIMAFNSLEIKDLEERRRILVKKIENEKILLNNIEKNIKKHIGKNFKYYLAYDFIKNTDKILESKKKEGVLPSNIKDTFIDDIIKNGKCICGTCIKKDTNEYRELLKLKEVAGSKALDNAYYNLKSLISKIKNKHSNFYNDLDKFVEDRTGRKENIDEYKIEIESISNKLKNCDIEQIKLLEDTRNSLKIEIQKTNQRIAKEKVNKDFYLKEYENLKNQIKAVIGNNKQTQQIKSRLDVVEELQKLNIDFKELFTEIVREELDFKIKEVFSSITNKEYRVPVLTKNFELKIVSKLNQLEIEDEIKKDELLSTGEGQITSLSFIGALVAYARENKDDNIMSRLTGEEYPIVMDSPFGNLDESHTENVAKNIGELSSQVIIIVSQKQWSGHVENNIISQVNKIYKIKDSDINKVGAECSYIKEVK